MLDTAIVKDIIKAGRPAWVKESEKDFLKFSVHINGTGTAEYLDQIQKFENLEQLGARKQLVTSNRFLFANLGRPIDKVFSATGGTSVLPKKNKDRINKAISNIRHGYSTKKWIQNVQANRFYTDPNGLVFFEWTAESTYPTVKAITSIFNYQTSGRLIDWVLFMPEKTKNGELYRFVDAEYDYTLLLNGESLTIVEDKTYKNPFGRCPGIVNSDIMHFELNRKDSPFAPVIELADHYLRTGSVKNIYENYHGYPIFWAYGMTCKRCNGEGSIVEDGEPRRCPSCDGAGTTIKKDVTDIIKLKPPTSSDQPRLAPDIAGYVQPDLETWREQRTELDWLWQLMHFTIWGTSYKRDQQTATATFIDAQPVNDALNRFSESFEDMEQKMIEMVALYFNGTANDVSVNWGRRFILESPDAIWNKYITAKEKGANRSTLDYLLNQFYQSEYTNDKQSLLVAEKSMKIEPFIHLTEKEVKDLGVTGIELQKKIMFNEWTASLQDGYIFLTDIVKLRSELTAFVEAKMKANEIQAEP